MKTASPSAETEFRKLVSRLQQRPPNVPPVQPVPPRPPHVQRIINNLNAQQAAQAVRQAQAVNGNGGGNNANNAGGNGGGGGNGGAGGGNNAGNGNQPRGGFFSRMSPANRATLKLCLVLILSAVVGILMLLAAAWIQQSVGAAAAKTYKDFGDVGAPRKGDEGQASAQISGTARMHAECGRYTVPQRYTIEGSCFYYENTTTNPVKVPLSSVARPRSIKANFEGKGDVLVTVGDSSCTSTLTYHCRDYLVTHVSQADGKYNTVLQVPPGQGAILTVR